MSKWNLNKITSEIGHVSAIETDNEVVHKDITKFHTFEFSKQKYQPLFNDVSLAVNSHRTGWHALKVDTDKKTKIIAKLLQPCTYFVYSMTTEWAGGLNLVSDRPLGSKTEKINMDFQKNMFHEDCEYAEQLWRVEYSQVVAVRPVWYVIVSTGTKLLERILQEIDQAADFHTKILIVWMEKTEKQANYRFNTRTQLHFLNLGPPFSRSIGLKAGYNYIASSFSSPSEETVVFSIDDSLILPAKFTSIIRSNVICGKTTYTPIVFKCTSCDESNVKSKIVDSQTPISEGSWTLSGFGMIGICLSDYNKHNGYDERWAYHWGAEDVDLYARTRDMVSVRPYEPGFIYFKPETGKTNRSTEYYTGRNLYDKELPVSPVSIEIKDETFADRLREHAQKFTHKRLKINSFGKVYRTYSDGGQFSYYTGADETLEGTHLWVIKSALSPVIGRFESEN